jgi:hypothetical protein
LGCILDDFPSPNSPPLLSPFVGKKKKIITRATNLIAVNLHFFPQQHLLRERREEERGFEI